MNIHQIPSEPSMSDLTEMRVVSGVEALHLLVDELIGLRDRNDTADLMLFERESLHIANAKLSNLVADLFAASKAQ